MHTNSKTKKPIYSYIIATVFLFKVFF